MVALQPRASVIDIVFYMLIRLYTASPRVDVYDATHDIAPAGDCLHQIPVYYASTRSDIRMR